MALSKLSGDEAGIIFTQLCNTLEPGVAVALSSVSHELREPTQPLLQQLRADHEAAAALGLKAGMQTCRELREANTINWNLNGLTAADLALLGKLGSVLPMVKTLHLYESVVGAAGLDGVQRLVAGLGAGALPSVTELYIGSIHVGNTGASALAAALVRGALPRLEWLSLSSTTIGDAGLVALAPALRRLPALESLILWGNPFGNEGLVALVAPPPPADAPPPTTRGLTKLSMLDLDYTQASDAGCAALAAALDSGALPALTELYLDGIPASAAAKAAVREALARSPGWRRAFPARVPHACCPHACFVRVFRLLGSERV